MDVRELFGDGAISAEQFMERLAESGMVILEGCDGGYVPASRERELERCIESERERYTREMDQVRAKSALVCALTKHGAHNPTLAATAIGLDGIAGDDGEMARTVEERVSALKSNEPYMFAVQTGGAVGVSTGGAHGGTGVDTENMSDSEYYRYRNIR